MSSALQAHTATSFARLCMSGTCFCVEGETIALLMLQLPVENGEDLQILRYEHGQKYDEVCQWCSIQSLLGVLI